MPDVLIRLAKTGGYPLPFIPSPLFFVFPAVLS